MNQFLVQKFFESFACAHFPIIQKLSFLNHIDFLMWSKTLAPNCNHFFSFEKLISQHKNQLVDLNLQLIIQSRRFIDISWLNIGKYSTLIKLRSSSMSRMCKLHTFFSSNIWNVFAYDLQITAFASKRSTGSDGRTFFLSSSLQNEMRSFSLKNQSFFLFLNKKSLFFFLNTNLRSQKSWMADVKILS